MTADVDALIEEARELSSGRTLDEYDVNPWIDQSQTALSDLADALEAALADAARLREALRKIAAGPWDSPASEPWSKAEALIAIGWNGGA